MTVLIPYIKVFLDNKMSIFEEYGAFNLCPVHITEKSQCTSTIHNDLMTS